MHIPDGLLDPKVSTGMMGVAVAVVAYSLAKVREMVTALAPAEAFATAGRNVGSMVGGVRRVLTGEGQKFVYKMGMVAAIIFVGQMLDFTITNGTSGHLIGGLFASVILGPFAGALVMAAVLTTQMLFFADGGLLAIGANIINMALLGTVLAYYIYCFIKRYAPEWVAIAMAAWFSVNLMALGAALELGVSGAVPFSQAIPAMLKVHIVIGIAEALITLVLVNAWRTIFRQA